ncbi:MAG: BrxA/BrxB family bacilliredoxin [Gemmatimonadetes bacterium]|nr:BrxA/BrxB family bacilliredoxin [Gemmatimonadota bacterium]
MTAPMRDELTAAGFSELRSAAAVDEFMAAAKDGTALVVVNSICGCASGCMRPAVVQALDADVRPHHLGTVFAGQDLEATERAREYFTDHPPSSPAVALFRQGSLVFMLERHRIQGRHPQMIANELGAAFQEFCAAPSTH